MVNSIKDTINLRVVNHTAFPQNVNMLGGNSDPFAIAPHLFYEWDLSNENYFGNVSVSIVISSTANPTPVTYTIPVYGYNIQSVAFALNTLNMGNFQVSGNIIYVSNDFYIYGNLTVLSTAFISTWNTNNTTGTSSANNQIQLPLDVGGTYNFIVQWGDGTSDVITSWNQPETLHTYATAGTYTIGIVGTISEWSFGNSIVNDNQKLLSISSWGALQFGTSADLNFYQCINLDLSVVTDVPDLSATTYLQNAFDGCTSLTTINRSNEWNTSNITNMIATFADCSSFNSDISTWDVSNCTNMNAMFYNCQQFNSNISGWNTSLNTSMYAMFTNCQSFNQPIGSWNTSSVTTMQETFSNAFSFNQPLNTWDVSNVTNMLLMFNGAFSFNQNLNSWNTSSVTNMQGMFSSASSFNGNIGTWNTSSVTDMSGMFVFAQTLNQSLNSWNTSNVTDMSFMFLLADNFNGNITSWNTSNVTTMRAMFSMGGSGVPFNQNISGWNVSNVTDMQSMFTGCFSFNQPIGSWNVSSVTTMKNMFAGAVSFNQNIGSWNISNVADFTDFMQGKSFTNYSTANLNAIYNGWSLLTVQPNININFATIKYTLAGQAGKNILTGAPNNWIIADGGI